MKRYDDAIEHLERAIELVDGDLTIAIHLGDAYFARKEYRKALPLYRKALKDEPDRADLAEKIRKIKQELGEK
jgi:tetratricopeptide (TPR) repeat protein